MKINKPLVSVEWLNDNLSAANVVILDGSIPKVTNDTNDNNQVQIPGARFFDIKKKFSNLEAPFPNTVPSEEQFIKEAQNLGINQDSIIIVYDEQGIYSSARVWYLFKVFGYNNVAVLDGGLPKWIEKGFLTEPKSVTKYAKGNFKGKYNPNFFKFFEDIEHLKDDETCQILDARSSGRFHGIEAEPRAGLRSGYIPNSKSLPFKSLMNGYCFKPVNELKIIFSKADIDNKKLVFSCGSGITACILALAFDLIGYSNYSVYDGSWTEYGTLTT